jgi:hypothetical protein
MDLNKVIKLTDEPFDVAGMPRIHRILYFKRKKEIIIKSNADYAIEENNEEHHGKAIILSPDKAVRMFPKVFTNSSKTEYKGEKRTIILTVPSKMYDFCCRQGCISYYLRSLIEREMKGK